MTYEEKIDFIKRYCGQAKKEIQIYEASEISSVPEGVIPDAWYEIFAEADANKRITKVLNIWKKYVSDGYSNVINYLEENLVNIELLKVNEIYSMFYSIKRADGKLTFYEGGNLLGQRKGKELKEQWDKIPQSIRTFYENVHNGFYEYTSWSMGLEATQRITYFEEYDWGIVEDLKEPLQLNFTTTFGFFSNCGGSYVAVDLENCENDNATLWFHDDQPKYNQNFWDLVDDWTLMGLRCD